MSADPVWGNCADIARRLDLPTRGVRHAVKEANLQSTAGGLFELEAVREAVAARARRLAAQSCRLTPKLAELLRSYQSGALACAKWIPYGVAADLFGWSDHQLLRAIKAGHVLAEVPPGGRKRKCVLMQDTLANLVKLGLVPDAPLPGSAHALHLESNELMRRLQLVVDRLAGVA